MENSGSMVFKVDHFVATTRRKKRVFYSRDLKELILKISRQHLGLLQQRDMRYFHSQVATQLEERGYDIGKQALSRKLREILDEQLPLGADHSSQFASDLEVVRDAIGKVKQARTKDDRLMFKGDKVFDAPIQMGRSLAAGGAAGGGPVTPRAPGPAGGQHTMSVSPQQNSAMSSTMSLVPPMAADTSAGANLNDPRRPNSGKSKDKRLQYKGHVIHLDEFREERPEKVAEPTYTTKPVGELSKSPQDFSTLLDDDISGDLQADLSQELPMDIPQSLGQNLAQGLAQNIQGSLIDPVLDSAVASAVASSSPDVTHLLKRLVNETERLRNVIEQSLAWEKERARQAHEQRRMVLELQKEKIDLVRAMSGR